MGAGWLKFAILGSTYARALGNAAQRSGAQMPQGTLNAIAARPDTRIAPGLAQRARGGISGATAPTPGQAQLQSMTQHIPETGEGMPATATREAVPGEGARYQRHVFDKMFGNRAPMSTEHYTPPAAPTPEAAAPRGPFPPRARSPQRPGGPPKDILRPMEMQGVGGDIRGVGSEAGTVVRRKVAAAYAQGAAAATAALLSR